MSHLVEIQAKNIKKFNYMRLGNYHDKYGKLVKYIDINLNLYFYHKLE